MYRSRLCSRFRLRWEGRGTLEARFNAGCCSATHVVAHCRGVSFSCEDGSNTEFGSRSFLPTARRRSRISYSNCSHVSSKRINRDSKSMIQEYVGFPGFLFVLDNFQKENLTTTPHRVRSLKLSNFRTDRCSAKDCLVSGMHRGCLEFRNHADRPCHLARVDKENIADFICNTYQARSKRSLRSNREFRDILIY